MSKLMVSEVGSITGILTAHDNKPIVSCTVRMLALGGTTFLGTATTDAAGKFSFADVPSGRGRLTFGCGGILPVFVDVPAATILDIGTLVAPTKLEVMGRCVSQCGLQLDRLRIVAFQAGMPVATSRVHADGTFSISTLSGDQTLTFSLGQLKWLVYS
jgi:hypothetical protein